MQTQKRSTNRIYQIAIITFCFINIPVSNAVEFSLFGDTSFQSSSNKSEFNSFRLGQIDLIANQEISPKSYVVAELVLEDGGEQSGYEIDVERFAIVRQISESTQIGLGRFHTQLGIWNANFHHGSLIQDTVSRPFFLDFEDSRTGILPVHLVGLHLSGASERYNFQLMVGNSNGLNTSKYASSNGGELLVFNYSDLTDDKSYVARAGIRLLKGKAEIGLNVMLNQVVETGVTDATQAANLAPKTARGNPLFDQQITGVDFNLNLSNFYILTEYYQIVNKNTQQLIDSSVTPLSSESYKALAAYLQVGYHISDYVTLALRYESLDFNTGNTYMDELGIRPQTNYVVAFSYQYEESNALRFEYNQANIENSTAEPNVNYTIQWYFLLF